MKKNRLTLSFFFILSFFTTFAQNANSEENIVLNIAERYIGTPYVSHTLENSRREVLVQNMKEVDCTTFVEYVLAEVLMQTDTVNHASAKDYLRRIRYRNGVIDGYPSRLHYITEWISEGVRNGFFSDVTEELNVDSMYVALSYMSRHPQYYKHLSSSRKNIQALFEIEKKLSGRIIKWMPKDSIPCRGLDWIQNGDIIAFTVGVYGLDISHLGFAYYQGDNLHLLHASATKGKVCVEPVPLYQMLIKNRNWTGMRVVRPRRNLKVCTQHNCVTDVVN